MIIPPYLKKGDKIHIVSPAGKVKKEFVLPAAKWLTDNGFRVELGKNVFAEYNQLAGTDRQRLEDLQTALDDTEASAVLCSRGGYGMVRIIDKLNLDALFKYPKWIIGFSDITVLHSYINKKGMATVHGVMPRYFLNENGMPGESLQSLIKTVTGENIYYSVPSANAGKYGKATGELTGGNLAIITSLLGTPYEPDTDGKILFIEDINEYLYRIDRMMLQLKLSGKLKNLAGLVAGNFSEIQDNDTPFGKTVEQIITEAVEEYDYPVCFDFPAGHEEKNLALTLGQTWELNVKPDKTELKQVLII